MKKHFLLLLTFLTLLPLSAAQILADNGKSSFVIVHCGQRSEYGATLIQKLLRQATKANLPVIHEKDYKKGTPAIFVGATREAKAKKLIPGSYAFWEHRIDIEKGAVYLTGSDSPGATLSRGNFESGVLKAVITFLERFCGCCFFGPAPVTDYAAPQKKITLPDSFTLKKIPSVIYCISRSKQLEYDIATNALYSVPFYKSQGGHSYPKAVPMAKYFKSNPEYFALLRGKRNPTHYNHLCLSNKKVQELLYRNLLDEADRGQELVQLGQTDSFQFCQCENCSVLYGITPKGKPGDPGFAKDPVWKEKLWLLHRDLAKRFMKDRPGKKVAIMAYGPTNVPPASFKEFPENTWIELAPFNSDTIKLWQGYKVNSFSAYLYFWGTYNAEGFTPNNSFKAVQAEAAGYHKHNIKGLYRCGFGELPGLSGPAYYIWGKLLDAPNADISSMLKQYCRFAFPKAAPEMEEFYRYLDSRLDLQLPNRVMEDWNNVLVLSGKLRSIKPFELFKLRYPDPVLAKLESLLKKAEAKENNNRMKFVRAEFDYLRLTAKAARSMFAFRKNHSDANWKQALDDLEKREKFIKSFPVDKKGIVKYLNVPIFGSIDRPMLMTGGRLSANLFAPFNWGAVKLRKYNIKLCGRTMKADSPEWHYLVPKNRWPDVPANLRSSTVKVRCEKAADGLKVIFVMSNFSRELANKYVARVYLGPDSKNFYWFTARFGKGRPAWYKLQLTDKENRGQGDKFVIQRGRQGHNTFPAPGVKLAQGEQSVELFIPYSVFGKAPKAGEQWLLNITSGSPNAELIWEYNMEQTGSANSTAAKGKIIF